MNGLHACKPGNEPQVGQVKTFVVQQMTGRSGKPYTKIKSANAENGGTSYKITKVFPTGNTDSYGNVSFNIEIEPSNGVNPTPAPKTVLDAPVSAWKPTPLGGNDNRSNRIERQHSQEMAVRTLNIAVSNRLIDLPSLKELIAKIRDATDYYQRDISREPTFPTKPDEPPQDKRPSETASMPDDDDQTPF